MQILIVGGTRNAGHFLTLELMRRGHNVTTLNRGKTPDELPSDVHRLHCDRSDPVSLRKALEEKSFDAVVDMALYNETDAKVVAELLNRRVGHYLFISTGQVYLVRKGTSRPFRESDFELPLLPAPASGTRDHEEWLYGVEKGQAEEALRTAWENAGFPITTLRLPMVNSERDHFGRVHEYLLRLQDGGPILIPAGEHLSLRHVYVGDVVQSIVNAIESGSGVGNAYNISQDETLTIEEFLTLLAQIAGCPLKIEYMSRTELDEHSLIPDCSPFSDPWMSELDNSKSKLELGMYYTPVPRYLESLVSRYASHATPLPEGYARRGEELQLLKRK